MMYAAPPVEDPLAQGDILDSCPIFGLEELAAGVDLDGAPSRWRERVIVLTQACDLAQAKGTKVLVALLHPAQLLVERVVLKAPTIRDQVCRGLVYGWYFLPTAAPPIALPESIVDLRDLHTVLRAVLERLIADGKRLMPIAPVLSRAFSTTLRSYVHAYWPTRAR